MPFAIPTQRELIDEVASFFEDEIDGSSPRLRANIEFALARAQAGQTKDLYGHLSYILRQLFPDSADDINFWRWAAIWAVFQKPASPWQGTYTFTGVNGTTIGAGAQLQRTDGPTYTVDADATIASGTATVNITAETAGSAPNNEDGQQLALTSPIAGVNQGGTVGTTTLTGEDQENREDGLIRLLARIRTPPSGGGPGDYVRWALEVAGNTRAWEFPLLEGPNSVSIAFVRDNDGPGAAILPGLSERNATVSYIDANHTPVTVDLKAIALSAVTINVVLAALSPNTSDVRTAIQASVQDLLYREGGPGKTIALSRVREAISGAAGEASHTLTTPSADLSFASNEMPIIGTVTVS